MSTSSKLGKLEFRKRITNSKGGGNILGANSNKRFLSTFDQLPMKMETMSFESDSMPSFKPNYSSISARPKKFSVGIFAGTSYATFAQPKSFNVVAGGMVKMDLVDRILLQGDFSWRNLAVDNVAHNLYRITYDNNGLLIDEHSFEAKLKNVQVFETSFLVSYGLGIKKLPLSRVFAGLRAAVFNAPEFTRSQTVVRGLSPLLPEPFVVSTDYRDGTSRFDLGLVLGTEVPLTRSLYLDLRANLNFQDMTDDDHWNVDPHRNTFTDLQLSLRWDLFGF